MLFAGADADRGVVEADVDSLAAFAERLRTLAGLVGRANAAAYDPRTADFGGAGPPAASRLQGLNAAGLRHLAEVVERLDETVLRLRDAADYIATEYARSDAFAAATTDDVRAAWRAAGEAVRDD